MRLCSGPPSMLDRALARVLRPVSFRGKGRLLHAVVPSRGERIASIFGYRLRLDLAEHIQRRIYIGTFEARETRLVRRFLRRGMTVVDVGAHCGYYTLLAASIVGQEGRVFAVEPDAEICRRLRATVDENRLPWVTIGCFALAEAPGQQNLYVPPADWPLRAATMIPNQLGRPVSVEARTLDACTVEWGIDRIDLLKLDVEGYEARVLEGGARLLAAGRIGALLCEFNDTWLARAGTSGLTLYDTLLAHGFRAAEEPAAVDAPGVLNRFFMHAGCPR